MNKLLKGSIAAAAGVALLMGGAGTFAYWNATTSIGSGTIVAGDLKVTPVANGAWVNQAGTTITDISAYRVVPGDTLTYTQTVNILATGNTLKATVGLAAGSITATTAGNTADVALAGYLNGAATTATTVALTAGSGVTGTAPNYTIVGSQAGVTYPAIATVKITFPFEATATTNNNAKLGSVNLANLALSVTQIAS